MAYNYYPYQPNYFGNYAAPQPQAQPQPQQTNPNYGVNWVQGEAGARSWLTAPNTTVLLMDSEADRFYLKSTDASGMPLPLRVFDYTERRTEVKPQQRGSSPDYATKSDLSALEKQIRDEVAEMFRRGNGSSGQEASDVK